MQRLVIRGSSCTLGLGSYKLVSLSEAREQALANRKLARFGGDPQADRGRTTGVPTFAEAAETLIAIQGETWRAHSRFPGHALTPTGVMAIRCKQFHLPDL